MPEGDTIYRAARTLNKAIGGKVVRGFRSALPELERAALEGRTVESVRARGKNLLVDFDDGQRLHTHMMMEGSWHVYRLGEPWQRRESRAFAVIETEDWVAVCFDAPICKLLAPGERSPQLDALGPDLLDPEADLDEALRRLRQFETLPLGEAVMRQHLVAGIGNVYKSEVLFLERLDPFAPVSSVTDEALRAALKLARKLMKQNVGHARMRTTRRRFGSSRLWVYGRKNEPCFECGSRVDMRRQGEQGRSTYFCPRCQRSEDGDEGFRPTGSMT